MKQEENYARMQLEASNGIMARMAETISSNTECHRLITEEYTKHIDKLCDERDLLLKQNQQLTDMVETLQQILIQSFKSNNTINIK